MTLKLDDKYAKVDYSAILDRAEMAYQTVMDGTGDGNEFLGWAKLPENYDQDEFARIKQAATKIRTDSDVLVVVGIGGSYLGARAVIELMGSNDIEVVFAGNSLSSIELDKLLKRLDGKDWSINVISKSGTTLEPAIAFRILSAKLYERYGDGASERFYATTDANKGVLHDQAVNNGYEMFVVPDDIGGRYSVLTAVGLLPIAVVGIDINELMSGAKNAMTDGKNDAIKYAAIRNALYENGFCVESLACFEPSFAMTNEWWKQLFGESEGKDGKGILPDSMIFTTDLHSLGQYVQDGKCQLFETIVNFEKSPVQISIPDSDGNGDGLNYLAGRELSYANQQAYEATVLAHHEGGVPVILLNIPEINAYEIGYFIYFMEMACAVSAYMLGVNPFNQPGVEAYKNHMFRLLKRPE